MTTIQTAYTNTVHALRDLGPMLAAAVAVQHEPPPGGAARIPGEQSRQDVTDPTVDLVLDPRNVEVGRAIYAARTTLSQVASALALHTAALTEAVDAWEGRK